MQKIFDIHAHVNFAAYDEDRDDVIKRALDNNINIINVGTQKNTSESAVSLSDKYDDCVYASVGMHPIHAGGSKYHDKKELSDSDYKSQNFEWDNDFYETLGKHKKVVAIGECGLDYFRLEKDTKEKQIDIFIKHIKLANKLNKPLMLHVRGERGDDTPYKEALGILKKESKVRANFHFFAGSLHIAKQIWKEGHTTSFTGVITFTNDYNDIVKFAPQNGFMSETDCPYVAPSIYRGKRNEPLYVIETIKKISQIRSEPLEKTIKNIQETAEGMFVNPKNI